MLSGPLRLDPTPGICSPVPCDWIQPLEYALRSPAIGPLEPVGFFRGAARCRVTPGVTRVSLSEQLVAEGEVEELVVHHAQHHAAGEQLAECFAIGSGFVLAQVGAENVQQRPRRAHLLDGRGDPSDGRGDPSDGRGDPSD
eukprot:1029384-Prorocentrum_minimum.AAC.1